MDERDGMRARPRGSRWLVAFGLVLGIVGTVLAVAAAPAGAVDTTGLVCNNQKGRVDQDCVGDNRHGTITASFDDGGALVFHLEADSGFKGWSQLYICIPGTARTNSADCQGNTPEVLHPQPAPGGNYDVTAPATNTENDKDVAFACARSITAVVAPAALPAGAAGSAVGWTVHVNACAGSTDEAFGSTTRPGPPVVTATPSYACAAATDVTAHGATLHGTTDDAMVDGATFSLTPTGAVAPATGGGGAWSAVATALQPSTNYSYTVAYSSGSTDVGPSTGTACSFTTAALGATQVEGVVLTRTDGAAPAAAPAAVLGTEVTAGVAAAATTAAAAAAVAVAPAELAATGAETGVLGRFGFALVLVGALALAYGSLGRPLGAHYRG